jgi:predicted dehydrogenase
MRGDRLMRKLVRAGFLGEPREVHVAGLSDANIDPNAPLHWRQDFELQGYNTLTLGMWMEILHRWMGPHSKVAARTMTFTPTRRDPETGEMRSVRIAESVAIAAELANGAIGSYRFSGVTRNAPSNSIALYGTSGTLVYDLDSEEISGAVAGEKLRAIPIPRDLERDWAVEADFIRAVREGGPVEPSFADGVLYMEFTEAVYRSSQTDRAISLPLEFRA